MCRFLFILSIRVVVSLILTGIVPLSAQAIGHRPADSETRPADSETRPADFETRPASSEPWTADSEPIKCLTPWIMLHGQDPESVEPHIRRKIEDVVTQDMETTETYQSASGRFQLVFNRDGFHAVPGNDENNSGIPDYIERASEFADYSWQRQVEEMGFADPAADGPLTIEFRNIGSRTYGYTIQDGSSTRIVVHHNFINFPPNDDPEGNQPGALKVTIAHELKHAIQFATNQWQGDAGTTHWIEMDATMMENIVFPKVNDYYNYIRGDWGIFGNPRKSTPVAYSHVTWSLFFAEHLGIAYWVDVWEEIRRDPVIPMIQAMTQALSSDPVTGSNRLRELIARNYLWHAASGIRTVDGYGFTESAAYPDAAIEPVPDTLADGYNVSDQLSTISSAFWMFYPESDQVGQISLSKIHSHSNSVIGVLGYFNDGTTAEWIPETDPGGLTQKTSRFTVSRLDSIIIAVTNTDPHEPASFHLEFQIRSLPDVVVLEPNYPNPFSEKSGNPGTIIPFSVPEREHVVVAVYDVTGRKVARLFDREADPGHYLVPFNAQGLASGVYIYQIRAGSVRKTGKMTFVR